MTPNRTFRALRTSSSSITGILLALLVLLAATAQAGAIGQDPAAADDGTRAAQEPEEKPDETPTRRAPGIPAGPIVRAIEFRTLGPDGVTEREGLVSYDPARVAASLGVRIGQPLGPLDTGVRRVWAEFGIIVRNWRDETLEDGVRLIVIVKEMPVDFAPRFIGNATYDEAKLRLWAELGDRAQIYLHEKEKIAFRLTRAYKQQGFHFVEVEPRVQGAETADDEEGGRVIFEIREGPKVRSTSIEISGNASLPDTGFLFWKGGLRSLAGLDTKGRGLFRWWGKPFVLEQLQADVLAMRNVYRERGWRDAKVEIEALEFNEDRSRVAVRILVDEGALYRVGSIDVQAFERVFPPGERPRLEEAELIFPRADLLAELQLTVGVPFEQARIDHDERALRNYYGERGYLAAILFENPETSRGWDFLTPDRWHDPEKAETHVVYRIVQGQRRTLREVRIAGNSSTRDKVVRREISALPGSVVNTRELDRSLSRIRGTGFFADQNDPAHPPEVYVIKQVEGDPEKVDVIYQLEEGRVVDLALSGGIASDSGVVGLISLTMRNFDSARLPTAPWKLFGEVYRKEALHGNGETFAIDLSPGSEVNYGRILYSHPDVFGTHFDRTGLTAEIILRERRYTTHDEERFRGKFIISRLFGQGDSSLRGGPIYQSLDLSNFDFKDGSNRQKKELPPELLGSDDREQFHGFNLDFRNSTLDNRLAPSAGRYFRWNNDFFSEALGGDQNMLKTELTLDYYYQFGNEEADVRPGAYFGLGAAVAHPYEDTDFVHYGERFFLGGSTTLRGFRFRGVGPNQRDVAHGGETMHRGTLEYRQPLYTTPVPGTSRRREMVRGILFIDWGILDRDSFALDPEELRVSAGFGFGLTHPIPLSVNFGWPLREGAGDELDVFSFRISYR